MLGCIGDAEKITGNKDQRNVLAHLHFVTDEDIHRMAETGSVPAVPPLWTPKVPGNYEQEISYVGQELTDQAYPIKSFYDAGANVVFDCDFLHDDIEKVAQANIVATIIDGEEVYKG